MVDRDALPQPGYGAARLAGFAAIHPFVCGQRLDAACLPRDDRPSENSTPTKYERDCRPNARTIRVGKWHMTEKSLKREINAQETFIQRAIFLTFSMNAATGFQLARQQ
jgi:hypothetical protein